MERRRAPCRPRGDRRTARRALGSARAGDRAGCERDAGRGPGRDRVGALRAGPTVTVAVPGAISTTYLRSPPATPVPRRCPMVNWETLSCAPTTAPVVSRIAPGRRPIRSPRNARRPPWVMKQTSMLSRLAAVRRPSSCARARTSGFVISPIGKRVCVISRGPSMYNTYDWSLARSVPRAMARPGAVSTMRAW